MDQQSAGVVVELSNASRDGHVRCTSASSSGTVLAEYPMDSDDHQQLIITSGLVLKPLLIDNSLGALDSNHVRGDSLERENVFDGDLRGINDRCDVIVYGRRSDTDKSKISSRIRKKHAEILAIWRVPVLDQVLDSVMSCSSGWSFTTKHQTASTAKSKDEVRSRPHSWTSKDSENNDVTSSWTSSNSLATDSEVLSKKDKEVEQLVRKLLPLFVLVRTSAGCESNAEPDLTRNRPSKDLGERLLSIYHALDPGVLTANQHCHQSQKVTLVATPFGSLSPGVFLNSVSQGIVTNVAGQDGALIMTDARCVPGCEGGALYDDEDHAAGDSRSLLLGIIVAPFCWRQNEWVGLTFACSARPCLSSLLDSLFESKLDARSSVVPPQYMPATTSSISKSVVLVKVGSRWGSGVLTANQHGQSDGKQLLVTCSHVVRKSARSKVAVHLCVGTNERFRVEAVVLYATPPDNVYDICVLELTDKHFRLPSGLQLSARFANEGDKVCVIGHGLFDEHLDIPASITSGIISKVLHKDKQQIQIQEPVEVLWSTRSRKSCLELWSAMPGAFVVYETGLSNIELVDAVSGACYPHINLSIPSTILLPIMSSYAKYGDENVFQLLHEADPIIKTYWQLEDTQHSELKHKL